MGRYVAQHIADHGGDTGDDSQHASHHAMESPTPSDLNFGLLGRIIAEHRATIKRGAQQWHESVCENASDASWKNLNGLLPFGQNIDDPGEPSALDYYRNLPMNDWNKLVTEIGTLF